MSATALKLLRANDDDWSEYTRLRAYIRHVERSWKIKGELSEEVSWLYYIRLDRFKELKKKLIKRHLLTSDKSK